MPLRRDARGADTADMQAVTERAAPARLEEAMFAPLVERARLGELHAFEEIVRTLQGPIRSFARRMMRDPHLGDDAAQETFLRIWKAIGRHELRGKFVAWTFTVARNTCIEFLRRENRTPRPSEDIDVGSFDPYERNDTSRIVNEAIAALGEPYRSTFLLRETGLPYEEVAEILDCPVGTVRSRLHEARRQLADQLRPMFGSEVEV